MTPADFNAALKRLGLSKAACARELGVGWQTVYLWTVGKRKVPGPVYAWLRERSKTLAHHLYESQNPDKIPDHMIFRD